MSDREIVGWFTSEGQHIPIHKGESKQDAFNRAVGKREREIRANKEEADKRNVENSSAPSSLKQVDSKQFEKDLTKARDTRPDQDKWRVDEHTKEQLDERGCKCYTSQGGSTVAVDKNGDIISVCKAKGDRTVTGADLMRHAVKMGGTKLDSFYGNDRFYVANGFQAVSWTPFSRKYAPDGWDKSGCKGESVVFYKFVGVGKAVHIPLTKLPKFTGKDGYDNAMAYRDKH